MPLPVLSSCKIIWGFKIEKEILLAFIKRYHSSSTAIPGRYKEAKVVKLNFIKHARIFISQWMFPSPKQLLWQLYANFRRLPGQKVSISSSHSRSFCDLQPGDVQLIFCVASLSLLALGTWNAEVWLELEIWQNKATLSQNLLTEEPKRWHGKVEQTLLDRAKTQPC